MERSTSFHRLVPRPSLSSGGATLPTCEPRASSGGGYSSSISRQQQQTITERVWMLALLAAGFLFCVFLVVHGFTTAQQRHYQPPQVQKLDSEPYAHSSSGRLTKIEFLETQVLQREQQLTDLRGQLAELIATARTVDEQLQVKDHVVKQLQQKHEVEATAKARAESALGSHLDSLGQCMRLVSVLQSEAASCRHELDELRGPADTDR